MDFQAERRNLRLSVAEGGLATVMGSLLSGVFLTGYALALGATRVQIGLLFALPSLCGVAQLAGSYWIERFGRCKRLCLAASLVSRLLYLPMLSAPLWGAGMSSQAKVWLVIGLMAVSHALGALAGVAWLTWIKSLVPTEQLVRFFGRRNLVNTGLSLAICLAAGAAVDLLGGEPNSLAGFIAVFSLAITCGLVGLAVLSRIPAAEQQPSLAPLHPAKLFLAPLATGNYRRLVAFYATWNLAVNVAAPFVPVFFMQKLGLPIWWVVSLSTIGSLAGLAANNLWTSLAHRFGVKPVVFLATLVDALVPLSLVFIDAGSSWLLVFVHLGGAFNAPLATGPDNFVVKLAPRQNASSYMAVFRAIVGPATALAAVLGGTLAAAFQVPGPSATGLKLVFLVSFIGRVVSLLLLCGVHEPEAYSLRDIGRLLSRYTRRQRRRAQPLPSPAALPGSEALLAEAE